MASSARPLTLWGRSRARFNPLCLRLLNKKWTSVKVSDHTSLNIAAPGLSVSALSAYSSTLPPLSVIFLLFWMHQMLCPSFYCSPFRWATDSCSFWQWRIAVIRHHNQSARCVLARLSRFVPPRPSDHSSSSFSYGPFLFSFLLLVVPLHHFVCSFLGSSSTGRVL